MSLFEHEDYLTPAERAEALAMFRRGKWRKGVLPHQAFEREIMNYRNAEEGLPTTRLEKVKGVPVRSIVTLPELVGMVAITLGAFFVGRYAARKYKEAKASGKKTADIRGLDVVLGSKHAKQYSLPGEISHDPGPMSPLPGL